MRVTIIINMRDGVDERKIRVAGRLILEGKLVAFPTETVYGLGADALNENAVRRIFEAKGRPPDNPLIIHIADLKDLKKVAASIPREAEMLAKKFWPGPLTLVLPKSEKVPYVTTGGLDTVAVRMPAHPVALALIRASTPVAAPSANISGRPSPTLAEHVVDDFYGKIEAIIDGGPTWVGVESTVLDLTSERPTLLRPGGLPLEEIERVIGEVEVHPAVKGKKVDLAKAPGMKYRHYSPKTPVVVVEGNPEKRLEKIRELVEERRSQGLRVGVMATARVDADEFYFLGSTPEEVARNLFKALRTLDKSGVDVIIAEGIEEEGLGLAVMNRLRKAAGYRVIRV
ncbi:MAG: L-threonylcarbamoyladenylate synthase [Thermococcaceae archaeon]|nr:L-threonylcarbamoyladenylate synthase [Thermococcaceae archaeon]